MARWKSEKPNMTTTHENGLTIVRHEIDTMTSVYRGRCFLGSALPIYTGNRTTGAWTASGPTSAKPRIDCATEREAIEYLATPTA